ncbi:MAG TPA: family 16 glycoside hydrolase [Luteitalea sp.]|nr:family 16 glycoside hydrolase [Luteitalea sp.]
MGSRQSAVGSWRVAVTSLLLLLLFSSSAYARPEFFVFDNGVGRGSWTPEQQARTLKELGYDGISYNYTTPEDLAKWQQAFKAVGLKIYGLYVHTYVDAPEAFDARLPEAIKMLKGTPTVLWITVQKPKTAGDHEARAVQIVQHVADLAREHGVQVALYGHAGFLVEHGRDSARVVGKANRPNLGATINLCHEYMSGVGDDVAATVKAVAPKATRVSINGVDAASKNFITRLDQGDFDLVGYLTTLKKAGYDGPIGLQAYNVKGDTRENLAANIITWRRIAAEVDARTGTPAPQNTLSAREKADGWTLLFDGKTTTGWTGFGKPAFPTVGWVVEDGALKGLGKKGGDIITTSTYDDFEFQWDWRLSYRGNSGVKYFVDQSRGNETGAIGHEYQTIDDDNYVAMTLNDLQKTGAWYDVRPATKKAARPVGDWNTSKLVVKGRTVEHWLNGELVLRYGIDDPESAAGVAKSKFKDVKGYADKIKTPILLQDHDTVVWYRNVKVRQLR